MIANSTRDSCTRQAEDSSNIICDFLKEVGLRERKIEHPIRPNKFLKLKTLPEKFLALG